MERAAESDRPMAVKPILDNAQSVTYYMNDLISIIIPVYNHADALERARASIAKQSYANIEVIVVDDGSDVPVTVDADGMTVVRQENAGAPAARNKGFALSKGAFVIFWDADITAEAEMLEKMHHVLQLHPEAAYAYSNFCFGERKMPAKVFDIEALKITNYITSTSLIRRESVIPWDETLHRFQDWDVWLTMAEQGSKGIWIPEYLFTIEPRGHGGISTWLPSFAYKPPWRWFPGIHKQVIAYEKARSVIEKKHSL